MKRLLLIIPMISLLSACEGKQFFYPNEQVGPAYAQGGAGAAGGGTPRAPLDVPPELQAELEVPMAGEVASRADESVLPGEYQDAVAGRAVALDAKIYPVDAAKVFSAVVDAMTSMNVPVESVDSPSGIITSDWIRKGSASGAMFDVFGMNTQNAPTRHRYIVRVYRARIAGQAESTKLEVRVHGQAAINRAWVDKPLKRKVSEQLFVAVDEQLQRMQKGISAVAPEEQAPSE